MRFGIIVTCCLMTLVACDDQDATPTAKKKAYQVALITTLEVETYEVSSREVTMPPVVLAQCASDTDCDDGNPCTFEHCGDGICIATPVADGTSCADWNVCDGEETCQAGECTGTHRPIDCDDGNPETIDYCDPKSGTCRSKSECSGPKDCVFDEECEDGDPNTSNTCSLGKCVMHPVNGCFALEVNDCWQFYANVNDIYRTYYPFGGDAWQHCPSGHCQTMSWCGEEFASINLAATTSNPQVQELSRTSVWALDWYHCYTAEIQEQMFIGAKPKDMGCKLFCVSSSAWPQAPEGVLMWQCHKNYLIGTDS